MKIRAIALLLVPALLAAGCSSRQAPSTPVTPPVDQTVPAESSISVLTVQVDPKDAVVEVSVRVPGVSGSRTSAWSTRPDGTIVEEFRAGQRLTVIARWPGFITSDPIELDATAGRMPTVQITLKREPVVGRAGAVRLQGAAFADDAGEFKGLGLTLMWALWGERHDPARLDQNMAWAAANGFDYLRVLGMVGEPSWHDRVIDPKAPDYWSIVDSLIARAARHGLRLQITIFGDAQVMMPSAVDRSLFAAAWTDRVNREPARFTLIEVANEYWQNGIESADELRSLTRLVSSRTEALTAPSATACGTHPEGTDAEWRQEVAEGRISDDERRRRVDCAAEWRTLYSDSGADVATPHFDRDVSKSDGMNRPIRQPWEMMFGARDAGVRAYGNNEPIGPESSVAADNDPGRLAMAAAVTWLSRGAFYTLHTGAGIRGGGSFDLARGRSSNLWEVPNIGAIVAALQEARRVLPDGIANCVPMNSNANFPDRPFSVDTTKVTRVYQTVCSDGTVVALAFGLTEAIDLTARRPMVIGGVALEAGGLYRIQQPSAMVVGKLK